MKICGDLLRFLRQYLSQRTMLKIIRLNKLIFNACSTHFYPKILTNYVDYDVYINIKYPFKKYITKLSNVGNIDTSKFIMRRKIFKNDNLNQLTNIPINVTHIKFHDKFNQPIDELHKNVASLIFGDHFCQAIIIPPKVHYIKFGIHFHPRKLKLPDGSIKMRVSTRYFNKCSYMPKETFGSDIIIFINRGNNLVLSTKKNNSIKWITCN